VSLPCLLAIETSCDETAAAVLRGGNCSPAKWLAVALHANTAAWCPKSPRAITPHAAAIVQQALKSAGCASRKSPLCRDYRARACDLAHDRTSAAKGLAVAMEKPFIGVNHSRGASAFALLRHEAGVRPAVALV
jgi:N6-L-threonylcarbamoyladenine synthase